MKKLPQWVRAGLILNNPREIGNKDGLPSADKDKANKISLDQDTAAANKLLEEKCLNKDEVLKHPERYRDDPIMNKAVNALQTQAGIDHQQGILNYNKDHRPILLLKYRPDELEWRGSAMVSINDPDHAKNIAFIVPGTSESVNSRWLSTNNLSNLARESYTQDPNSAIIACMDYKTPDAITDLTHVANPEEAREGAVRIAGDANGIWAAHDPNTPMNFTAIGHSYGSTTVADACVDGMKTNNVILIGSPGMDKAMNASDLHLLGGNLFVGANTTDPVSGLGGILPHYSGDGWIGNHQQGLGIDPTDGSVGAIQFHAETPWSEKTFEAGDHSKYYDKGSQSLFSISDIITGNGNQLERDGMLVHHNIWDHESLVDGTENHYHNSDDANNHNW